uniref:Uncharacterized protein n=1 Tax=Anopheles maculatus TaxID=74869 RepID=A0A182SK14_9DIPT
MSAATGNTSTTLATTATNNTGAESIISANEHEVQSQGSTHATGMTLDVVGDSNRHRIPQCSPELNRLLHKDRSRQPLDLTDLGHSLEQHWQSERAGSETISVTTTTATGRTQTATTNAPGKVNAGPILTSSMPELNRCLAPGNGSPRISRTNSPMSMPMEDSAVVALG